MYKGEGPEAYPCVADDIHLEGTMSQISHLGLSFNFMLKNGQMMMISFLYQKSETRNLPYWCCLYLDVI